MHAKMILYVITFFSQVSVLSYHRGGGPVYSKGWYPSTPHLSFSMYVLAVVLAMRNYVIIRTYIMSVIFLKQNQLLLLTYRPAGVDI